MFSEGKFNEYKNILRSRILNNSIKWGRGILRGNKKPAGWTIDIREEILDPPYGMIISELLLKYIEMYRPDYIAGLATTGGFMASQLSLLSEIKSIPTEALYIRKEPKVNGLQKQIDGPLRGKSTAVIVDDSINSGDSAIEAIKLLAEYKCLTVAFISVLNFEGTGVERLKKLNIPFHYIFTVKELGLKDSSEEKKPGLYKSFWQGGPVDSIECSNIPHSAPLVVNKRIFIGSNRGIFFSVRTDGMLDWSFDAASPIFTDPLFRKGKVYFASYNGFLYCNNGQSGKDLWAKKIGELIDTSSPVFSHEDDVIFASSYDGSGKICAVNALNGDILWTYGVSKKISSTPGISKRNHIIFGSDDFSVYSLNKYGKILWRTETSGENRSVITVDDKSGTCYGASNDGKVNCFDLNDGHLLWSTYLSSLEYTRPLIEKNKLIITSSSGFIFCLNKINGEILWHKSIGPWDIITEPIIYNKRVYGGNSKGEIVVLDIKNGNLLWKFATGGRIVSKPSVVSSSFLSSTTIEMKKGYQIYKNKLLFINETGFIDLYNFEFNKILWRLGYYSDFNGKNLLFVISDNGYIYSFFER